MKTAKKTIAKKPTVKKATRKKSAVKKAISTKLLYDVFCSTVKNKKTDAEYKVLDNFVKIVKKDYEEYPFTERECRIWASGFMAGNK